MEAHVSQELEPLSHLLDHGCADLPLAWGQLDLLEKVQCLVGRQLAELADVAPAQPHGADGGLGFTVFNIGGNGGFGVASNLNR